LGAESVTTTGGKTLAARRDLLLQAYRLGLIRITPSSVAAWARRSALPIATRGADMKRLDADVCVVGAGFAGMSAPGDSEGMFTASHPSPEDLRPGLLDDIREAGRVCTAAPAAPPGTLRQAVTTPDG